MSINRTVPAKRAHQSGKINLKINSGNNIIIEDENRGPSIHNPNMQKKLDITDVMEKIQKKHTISVDRNKVTTDFATFSNIVN